MADTGGGTCVIRRDNWLSNFILHDRRVEEDLHFTLDPIPTNRHFRRRWGGKITTINGRRSREGLHTVELEMLSNREHLKHLLAGATPMFPPEFQPVRQYMFPWTCRTAIASTMLINLARQFNPFMAIADNILNPGAWLGQGIGGILDGWNPLWWPIQVQFVNPLFDQSRFEIITARWTDMHTVTAPVLEDAGCMIRAYTWLTEDEESPHPELGTMLGNLVRPMRNCVVLAVEDKSGITGPTGTFADGFIRAWAKTADDLVTSVIHLGGTAADGTPNPLFQKWLLVAPEEPRVVFRDGEYSAIIESNRAQHAGTAKTVMSGGKSPPWVNQLITFGVKYGLSQLSNLINLAIGTFENTAFEAPGTPGLEEVYQGQFDDMLLAYQRFTDPARAIWTGDFGYLEHFEQGSGVGWTLSTTLTLREGHWKSRAYNVYSVTVRNGAPHLLWFDYELGDRVSFEVGNVFHTDQVTGWKYSYDVGEPALIELSIGNDTQDKDPFSLAVNTLAGIWNMFGMFVGSANIL